MVDGELNEYTQPPIFSKCSNVYYILNKSFNDIIFLGPY